MDFESFSKLHRPAIDERLAQLLPSEYDRTESLHRSMRYAVLSGGKRLRPLIALALAEAVSGDEAGAVMDAACAVEFVHCFSLIHDDLPLLDDDDLRRGLPTVHVAFSEPIALLAGDALFALAFETLARAEGSDENRAKALTILAEASGTRGMVGGQTVDVESEGKPSDIESIEWIHRRKTGSLFAAAASLGALFANGTDDQVEQARLYGSHLGLAFQITDDILDETSNTEVLGKRSHADRNRAKATYPAAVGIDASRAIAAQSAGLSLDAVAQFPNPGAAQMLAKFAIERQA